MLVACVGGLESAAVEVAKSYGGRVSVLLRSAESTTSDSLLLAPRKLGPVSVMEKKSAS